MRTVLRCAAIALVAAALVACDSEQPTQGGTVEAVLAIDTGVAELPDINAWEIWEDTNFPADGIPDRPKRVTQPNGAIVYRCEAAPPPGKIGRYPWSFSVEVSVLRKGSTRPEVLSSTFGQTTRYTAITRFIEEDVVVPLADEDNDPTGPGDSIYATEYYRSGERVSIANPVFATRCAQQTFTANIGALPNPTTIALNPGDTLIVSARKAPANDNTVLGGIFPIPVLIGSLTVGGRPASTRGTPQSTQDDGDGISFSYTLN